MDKKFIEEIRSNFIEKTIYEFQRNHEDRIKLDRFYRDCLGSRLSRHTLETEDMIKLFSSDKEDEIEYIYNKYLIDKFENAKK